MASVSSLDQDMRSLRLSRYTAQAASEVRSWIEERLGEQLPAGDLLEALKDGVALCKLVNLVLPPPGVKYKGSAMPFVQMENISHFLRACEAPPLSLPAHDRFLTVDLYEAKDPAQVLQCISAFSRVAHALQSSRFPTIGPKKNGNGNSLATGAFGGSVSSNSSGGHNRVRMNSSASQGSQSSFNPTPKPGAVRPMSPVLTGGSSTSRATEGRLRSPVAPVSSWSKKTDEGITAPAWNIHQYGYMGGASQGNQGVTFGARRQITSAAPAVPSHAEKERRRREREAEEEQLRHQTEEAESSRMIERQQEEERERIAEERRWGEETRQAREVEKRRMGEQKRQWEEQERRWKMDEEARLKEEREALGRLDLESQRPKVDSDVRLRGQFLSQYQVEAALSDARGLRSPGQGELQRTAEEISVERLERQLEEAKARERQYLEEREERLRRGQHKDATRNVQPRQDFPKAEQIVSRSPGHLSSEKQEREYLQQERKLSQTTSSSYVSPVAESQLPVTQRNTTVDSPGQPSRLLLEPSESRPSSSSPRPLPNPSDYAPSYKTDVPATRTDRFLSANPNPTSRAPESHYPAELSLTSAGELAAEDARRVASQQKTKAGGWASKSLLEREMERDRERQREWEESQQRTAQAARDVREGSAEGQSWDVNQYGWVGGDNQNKGAGPGGGIGFGSRRQIIGPRPKP